MLSAITGQIATLGHVSNFFTTPAQVALAERLTAMVGAPGEAKVFFTNSGTEANEAAFKITRATGRTKIIATEGAAVGYGNHVVLHGLDLRIDQDDRIALLGRNGEGKTTLAKLLCRLYDPTSGVVEADGVDLRALDLTDWRQHVTAVFQDFVRFELSLRDNVAPWGAPDEEVLAAGDGDLLTTDREHDSIARFDLEGDRLLHHGDLEPGPSQGDAKGQPLPGLR